MAERLAEKYKTPEARGNESYNRGSNAQQVSDDVVDNAALLTGKCTFEPIKTVEIFTGIAAAGSVVVFDSSKVNSFGKPIVHFDVKTLTISSDAIATVEIKVEDEAGGLGAGAAIYTFFMDANQTITVPFAFGDKLQGGIIAPSSTVFRIVATTSAGSASVTASGLASI